MKCKRLCAWLLSLVMMFSLLPVSAAAADIPDAYKPTIKWTKDWAARDHSLTVEVINEGTFLGTISEQKKHLSATVKLETAGVEVYDHEASGGTYSRNTAKLFTFIGTTGFLKLYTRSKAGHTVTVNYVYTDDESKNGSKSENVKYAEEKSFGKLEKDYGYEITVSSDDVKYEVNSLNELWVTGGAEDSEITVTYTPKDVIYIDQYYDNGKLWVKWTGNNIKVNGPELLKGAAEAAVIEGEDLTDAVENYRFLTVNDVTYDFSFASLVPVKGRILQPITDVWYDHDEGTWYYSHTDRKGLLFGLGDKVPVVNRGCVNFCYNTPHSEKSEYHDWKWVHVDGTEKENSQHQQICKHCNKEGATEGCKFKSESIGTGTKYTCTVCGYSYTDEVTPTETPVYVYFKTVHSKDGNVRVNEGVTYNNPSANWATLGKLTTEQTVAASTDKTEVGKLGKEVNKTNSKFVKHQDNENFDLDLINEWVELKKEPNGAAGYESEAPYGKDAWHLNGKVNVYKLTYDANRPTGVTADVTVPDSAYYLPGWNAPVSTDDPTLQGYNFGGWYKEPECVNEAKEKVAVAEDTVLYAKWTPLAQPTADLIDDDITIKHGVNGDPEHGNDSDSTVHIVKKDAKISYQATLDMKNLDFGANPEHADTVSNIQGAMTSVGATSLWDFIKNNSIDKFADSKVNLYVKFSDKLENPATLDGIPLKSGWFKLDPNNKPTYNNTTGYWTIPCVIKDAGDEPDTNDSIVTLSRITLPLTAKAQGELSSDTELNVISEGYIDGTIKISTHELSLIGKSKDAPAKNTAKLKLAVPTYSVTYKPGDGAGTDKLRTYNKGDLLPNMTAEDFGFTAPEGKVFDCWKWSADKGTEQAPLPGKPDTIDCDLIAVAQWKSAPIGGDDGDDDDKYFFAIQKVDAQDGHALNGAKFELYQLDKNDRIVNRRVVETTRQSNKNGIALFSVDNKKSYDGIWYYAEVSAPEGYVSDRTEYEINDKDFSDSLSTAVKNADTVRNYRGTTPDLLNDSDHFAYVIGYMDGNVRPYGLISRAETTTIFFRLLKDSVRDGNLLTSNTYTDVADDYWANTAISTMTGLGIVQGRSTTTFDPKAPITRAQFAAICARFDTGKSNGEQTFSDIQGHWAEKYIQRAAELGWIKGFEDGTFRPDTYITRAQAMTMINRVLNRIPEDESDLLPGMNVWPDCNPGDWFYLTVQEATNSHDFKHKAGSYETWTRLTKDPDWTRYEN